VRSGEFSLQKSAKICAIMEINQIDSLSREKRLLSFIMRKVLGFLNHAARGHSTLPWEIPIRSSPSISHFDRPLARSGVNVLTVFIKLISWRLGGLAKLERSSLAVFQIGVRNAATYLSG
jgi:hypothetical protein